MPNLPPKYACISDLHIRKGHDGEWIDKYLGALQWCSSNEYPVFFLGDMIEGYDPATDIDNINPYVMHDLVGAVMDGMYVLGNHDNEIFDKNESYPEEIHDKRRKTILCHGHRFDMWFRDEENERATDWWGKFVYKLDTNWMKWAGHFFRQGFNSGFEGRAFDYMRSKSAKLMICGHTHDPKIEKRDGMTLAITGAWGEYASDDQRKIIVVDGKDVEMIGMEEM